MFLTGCSGSPQTPTTFEGNLYESVHGAMVEAGTVHFDAQAASPSGPIEVVGEARVDETGTDTSLRVRSQSGTSESRFVDGIFYFTVPDLHTETPWLSLDPSSAAETAALVAQQRGLSDPTLVLRLLSKAGPVTYEGTASIEGVATKRYSGAVPAPEALELLGYSGQSVATAGGSFAFEIWLDEADRPVQLSQAVSLGGVESHLSVEFSRYGEQVDIVAPPADQVSTPGG